jgi:hypothetical protein
MDRTSSPAYEVLRASSRRVLRLVESEIMRQGGGSAAVWNDMLECCASRRAYLPALCELAGLGFITVERHPKKHICRLANGWRDIASMHEAVRVSARARTLRHPPMTMPPQPATASVSA